MMTSNQMVQQQPHKMSFSAAINTPTMKRLITNTLQDPERCARYIANIVSAVAVNPALQSCDYNTVISGSLLGESLKLSPSPQMGQYYLVPFKQKAKYDRNGNLVRPEVSTATFVLGYKGYIQLALRSGQYKRLNAMVIKQGEYKGRDPLTGEAVFRYVENDDEWDKLPIIGYMAAFEYLNGFSKVLYWSKEKMMTHADRYSAAFSRKAYENLLAGNVPQNEMYKYSSYWYKDFDGMALKTMLRQLISKWGVMSIEMQVAFDSDNKTIKESENGQLVPQVEEEPPQQIAEPQAAAQIPAQPAEPKQIDLSSL